jgi:stalled ribosome alternative rescue factor ArfA
LPRLEDAIVFALAIAMPPDGLNAIKAELNRTLPDIKSSHRCEAIARGLGFRTYASAKANTQSATPDRMLARGRGFVDYLAEHGFVVPAKPFYHAVARVTLRHIGRMHPKLTMWGIGVGRPQRKADGKWENWEDRNARFVRAREELMSDSAVEPFLTSLAFVVKVERTKTIRKGTGSYRLKHIAENFPSTYPEGNRLGPQYVANGALIAAAIHAGFQYRSYVDEFGYDDLNVNFNMSKPSIDELDCEIRPNGPHAQTRKRRAEIQRYRYSSVIV